MVWDDSTLYSDEDRGGACVPLSDIELKARRRPHQLEVLRVNLMHDPASFAMLLLVDVKIPNLYTNWPAPWFVRREARRKRGST